MDEKKPKENGMEKLAAFIVDKRNLIFLLYVFALIFSIEIGRASCRERV